MTVSRWEIDAKLNAFFTPQPDELIQVDAIKRGQK